MYLKVPYDYKTHCLLIQIVIAKIFLTKCDLQLGKQNNQSKRASHMTNFLQAQCNTLLQCWQ